MLESFPEELGSSSNASPKMQTRMGIRGFVFWMPVVVAPAFRQIIFSETFAAEWVKKLHSSRTDPFRLMSPLVSTAGCPPLPIPRVGGRST
ncbi:hypothetical protein AXG93_4537s1080 [Marchantia polymorpha subsp. ruderalis]|uniref:Uncharacterized protein n=1 Tax=Marchantia polymorpha subsp. ruderalis TaxID=1480154 RepID=A0A176VSL2_MARPO|nr:hypothetical protein AXG93_4537s1080 [Marchantia polymorpha subsp. ruderalis]